MEKEARPQQPFHEFAEEAIRAGIDRDEFEIMWRQLAKRDSSFERPLSLSRSSRTRVVSILITSPLIRLSRDQIKYTNTLCTSFLGVNLKLRIKRRNKGLFES